MDPFKLLSRSTKLSKSSKQLQPRSTPSGGQNAQPQLFGGNNDDGVNRSRKRKRGENVVSHTIVGVHDLHPSVDTGRRIANGAVCEPQDVEPHSTARPPQDSSVYEEENMIAADGPLLLEERRKIMKEHRLKITRLDPPATRLQKKGRSKSSSAKADKLKALVFPEPMQEFDHLTSRYGVSRRLANNVAEQGFTVPTEVQLGALPLLLDSPSTYLSESGQPGLTSSIGAIDLLAVAPTGSGKTLAFLLPLLHKLQQEKRDDAAVDRHISALILAPTRELASQTVNEGRKLSKNTGITITQMRKGMRFGLQDHDNAEEEESSEYNHSSLVKADIIVSTPGIVHNTTSESENHLALSKVRHLILDEADVLLDPLFRDQTLEIWNTLSNPKLRVSMWSATMGSNIEALATATIAARRRGLNELGKTRAEVPLLRLVVGLKDSAVPNVQHKLVYAATEQGKLMGLRQLLRPASSTDSGPSLRPPFLIFTQTIERAVALHAELLYDIPVEAGGISRIAVLHSDLSDTARDNVMTRFRKGEIWVLITTDLLSRGVDFRGINGVVNYDIPTSSAAYVHRIGRTGRAGREGGVAVTLYSKEDIPYLKHVANVVAMAQKGAHDDAGLQQWLLDAIPTLSKNDKQSLKKHGIQSRTARGKEKDPKAARKARISTKAGFVRQAENKRKGAVLGSQRRAQAEMNDDDGDGDETDFGGFD
ncbi:RNA-dependent ATPase rok1 [Vermiconidia calcicola]|uniref:RNA-dependent ATPase rok1 n=1 Tax=Vermiconidia calcicola TaxID=1690605 RepID=A0ACC3NWV0_9PEZI|nr:RNA-dependent ATPase rok1 [Vermiconidia calcicola]